MRTPILIAVLILVTTLLATLYGRWARRARARAVHQLRQDNQYAETQEYARRTFGPKPPGPAE
jgi:hypothetical protein